jgi:hypothetical protein
VNQVVFKPKVCAAFHMALVQVEHQMPEAHAPMAHELRPVGRGFLGLEDAGHRCGSIIALGVWVHDLVVSDWEVEEAGEAILLYVTA